MEYIDILNWLMLFIYIHIVCIYTILYIMYIYIRCIYIYTVYIYIRCMYIYMQCIYIYGVYIYIQCIYIYGAHIYMLFIYTVCIYIYTVYIYYYMYMYYIYIYTICTVYVYIYIYWIHNNCITNIHQFNQPDVRRRRLQVFSLGHQQLGTLLPCEASVESWLPNGHFVGKIESNNGLNIGSIWTYIYILLYMIMCSL